MKKVHLTLFIHFITVNMFFFFTLEAMLYCAFTVILNPKNEHYLRRKIFHESLQCHRVAASYHCTQSNDVGELIDQNPSGSKKK